MKYEINPERLAYWYLRLNGFLTIENFIVHDEQGGAQRTDVDLMGLRLPNRREALRTYGGADYWMTDDPRFADKKIPFAAFVEVATGQCKLNGPWTDRAKANLPRAIRALGPFATEQEVERASDALYTTGQYTSESLGLGLISIGSRTSLKLSRSLPDAQQILWREVTDFIFDRFDTFEQVKRGHPQWDLDGHLLWQVFEENRNDKAAFRQSLELRAGRPNGDEVRGYFKSRCRG